MSDQPAVMEFTAGRLLCGHIRSYLEGLKFKGFPIDYMESSGWIERDFIIKGTPEAISFVRKVLREWVAANNLQGGE